MRFSFLSQRPRDDGCGIVVLQMLTNMTYDDIAHRVSWGDRTVHYMTWVDICAVLRGLGWAIEKPIAIDGWAEIEGIAIVHVKPDHFILYDADEGLFYDPAAEQGPVGFVDLTPMTYLKLVDSNGQSHGSLNVG